NYLFTMSFFLSEVHAKQEQTEKFFKNLFLDAKPSSMFLFVDNSSGYARDWFDKLVRVHNQLGDQGYLKLIKKSNRHVFQMESSEQTKDLEPYYSKFREFGRNKFEVSGLPKVSSPVD